jgi:hypothetical protein
MHRIINGRSLGRVWGAHVLQVAAQSSRDVDSETIRQMAGLPDLATPTNMQTQSYNIDPRRNYIRIVKWHYYYYGNGIIFKAIIPKSKLN